MIIRKKYFNLIQWFFNHYIDGQTSITKRLAAFYNIPKQKLWGIWESGVDLEHFQHCISERQWEQIRDTVHLIYIGTLNDGRNIGVFCQAVINRAVMGQRFVFTVVGNGFERSHIELLARENPHIIQYQKTVPHHEIPYYLTKAHLGVLPFPDETKFQVSSPIKLFEYMASGLPILATRIVCHTDVISNNDFIFWAEESSILAFENTLTKVWENRENLPIMSGQAANAVHSWTWLESAKKLKMALEFGINQ